MSEKYVAGKPTIGQIHRNIMRSCYDEKCLLYKSFGAKGITVCEEWKDRQKFREWVLNNGWKPGLTVNRKDTTKGYYPNNCFFGTSGLRTKGKVWQYKESVRRKKELKREIGVNKKISEDKLYKTYISMHTRCEDKNIKVTNITVAGI